MIGMSQIARTAILKIIDEEGGWVYSDHPIDTDRGTYAGVRYRVFAEYFKNNGLESFDDIIMTPMIYKDMADSGLIKDIIIDIYYEQYYKQLQIDRLPDVLKMPVFSCGVNTGQRRAGIILQRAINDTVVNRLKESSATIEFLAQDGIIGKKTIAAIDNIFYGAVFFGHNCDPVDVSMKVACLINMDRFRNRFVNRWIQRYINITVDRIEYTEFLAGWFNRASKYWVL